MTVAPGSLARNTSVFTLALVGQKVISFAYFTYLARFFGPGDVGRYVFALSFATLFSVLLDLGLASVLTREVAREPQQASRLTSLVFGFKLVAVLVVCALAVATINLLGYPSLTRQLVYLACLVMVLDSFTLSAYSTIRGFHTLAWESIGSVLMQSVVGVLGVAASLYTRDLRAFLLALVVAAAANLSFSLYQLRRRFSLRPAPVFEARGFRYLLQLAWPFALAAVLTRAYGYLDIMLLSVLKGDHALGIYSLAYKVTFALQFIPTAFAASLLPGFSSYYEAERAKLADTFVRGVAYLVIIAVPLSFGLAALAPAIVRTVYPAFHESVVPLQVLVLSLVPLFATFPIGSLLSACNRQKRNTLNLALAVAVNLALNLLLIPRFGPTGAALASAASTGVLLVVGWQAVRRVMAARVPWLAGRVLRSLGAGLAMAAVVLFTKPYLHFTLAVPLGGFVYLGLLFATGGLTSGEVRSLWQVLMHRPAPSA